MYRKDWKQPIAVKWIDRNKQDAKNIPPFIVEGGAPYQIRITEGVEHDATFAGSATTKQTAQELEMAHNHPEQTIGAEEPYV